MAKDDIAVLVMKGFRRSARRDAAAAPTSASAKAIGTFTHLIMMGTVVFGLAYTALFTAFGDAGVGTGLMIRVAHGIVAGIIMIMFGAMHPRLDAPVSGQTDVVTRHTGESRITAPGLFAKNHGPMTPMGLVIGPAVYGLVIALVYSAIA